jgi:hypothetical protein
MSVVQHKIVNTSTPKQFLPNLNFVPWPTSDPKPTLVRRVQKPYCVNHVALWWLTQASWISPFPSVAVEIQGYSKCSLIYCKNIASDRTVKQSTDEQGTLQVCVRLEMFNMGTICHMVNIKAEFKFLHHFVQCVRHHSFNDSLDTCV